jgi:hypothetical protein
LQVEKKISNKKEKKKLKRNKPNKNPSANGAANEVVRGLRGETGGCSWRVITECAQRTQLACHRSICWQEKIIGNSIKRKNKKEQTKRTPTYADCSRHGQPSDRKEETGDGRKWPVNMSIT